MSNRNQINFDLRHKVCLVGGCGRKAENRRGICTHHVDRRTRKKLQTFPHLVDWIGEVRRGEQEIVEWEHSIAQHSETTETLYRWMRKRPDEREEATDKFVGTLLKLIPGQMEDASTLQLKYELRHSHRNSRPRAIAEQLRDVVDEAFQGLGEGKTVWASPTKKDLRLPVRVVAALLATGYAAEEINRGDLWFMRHMKEDPQSASQAGVYMSAVYYLLRRREANEKQAKMASK